MRLFFTQGGSRLKRDTTGRWYTDSNFNNDVWNRYKRLCDELIVVLRCENREYEPEYAMAHFSPLDESGIKLIPVPDIYRPHSNFFKPHVRQKIKAAIRSGVERCDKAIIRSAGNYYASYAGKCCRKLGRPYLSEATGFSLEGCIYSGWLGKLKALPSELGAKRLFRHASYVIYVTDEALQRRYPSDGVMRACSDAGITSLAGQMVLRQSGSRVPFVLGSAAAVDVRLKGLPVAVRAVSLLKERGCGSISYEIAGLGTGQKVKDTAAQLGVGDRVKLVGGLPHEQVFEWLDGIDLYIQPSFTEGLSRSIVEAMSRACPVIATDVGGNSELIDREWLVPAGDAEALADKIQQMIDHRELAVEQSRRNLEKAKAFDKVTLDAKREAFYREFVEADL